MDSACIHQMRPLLLVKAFQIWDMLEIIRIKIAALYHFIRLYIVVEHRHLKLIPFRFQKPLGLLQYLRMRSRRRRNLH